MRDLTGLVEVLDGYGGVASSCVWTASDLDAQDWQTVAQYMTWYGLHRDRDFARGLERGDAVLEPGCAAAPESVLPPLVPTPEGALPRGSRYEDFGLDGWYGAQGWSHDSVDPGQPWFYGLGPQTHEWVRPPPGSYPDTTTYIRRSFDAIDPGHAWYQAP